MDNIRSYVVPTFHLTPMVVQDEKKSDILMLDDTSCATLCLLLDFLYPLD